MVWSCETVGGVWNGDVGGEIGITKKKEGLKIKEIMERFSKAAFGILEVDEKMTMDRRRRSVTRQVRLLLE